MAGIIAIQRPFIRKILPAINRRFVSTSKKNNETITAEVSKTKAVEHKNWISYGYDTTSKAKDRNAMHSIMFASVTVCLVGGGFVLTYLPDYNLRDWAVREAFLELRRREQNSLPQIDRNFIDPAKIELPSDEELGSTEIII